MGTVAPRYAFHQHVHGAVPERHQIDDGQPDFYVFDLNSTERGVDLFTSLAAAQAFANEIHDEDNPLLIATALSSDELLSCLSRVDVVAINLHDYAVTRRGQVALGCAHVATTPELLRALAAKQDIEHVDAALTSGIPSLTPHEA